MEESVRNIFFVVTRKISRPGLATKSADLVPAPSFDSKDKTFGFAGDGGIEPPTTVLETVVIPLN